MSEDSFFKKLLSDPEIIDGMRYHMERWLDRMYKSPIEIIYGEMKTEMGENIVKAVQKYEILVDKEELIKALNYDRDQYKKGYEDAIKAVLVELEKVKNDLADLWLEGYSPYTEIMEIIDRHLKEVEE